LVATALLVIGALARSAQLPFHGWLPATAGARPSAAALLHSVSGILIGVVVLARIAPLLQPGALLLAATAGAATALIGAIVAVAEDDRRRALAWSTASHAGLMFAAIGMGALGAALFHLLAHAFVKATLLLAPDVAARRTWGAFGVLTGALGLGLLPPSATFFSGLALAAAFAEQPLLLAALLAVALFSGLHAGRLVAATFIPPHDATGSQARGRDLFALAPVVVLGLGTLAFGVLVALGAVSLGVALSPSTLGTQIALAVATLAGAALGLSSRGRVAPGLGALRDQLAPDALVARASAALVGLLAGEGEALVRRSEDGIVWLAQRGSALTDRIADGGVRGYQAILWAAAVTLLAYWTLR
jgi:NADH:ubiquinone oxidoreductase subunit 5 (subunit L)/multisubunit Na+/H+ antiporter MnhA subunit